MKPPNLQGLSLNLQCFKTSLGIVPDLFHSFLLPIQGPYSSKFRHITPVCISRPSKLDDETPEEAGKVDETSRAQCKYIE